MNFNSQSILLALLLLLGISTKASADDVKWIDVATAEEFVNAVKSSTDGKANYNANIRLTADIDLSSLTGTDYLFSSPFAGRLTGECKEGNRLNYALKGQTETLFNCLKGCTIEHLVFPNGTFKGRDASSGLLADVSENATINDVIFSGTHVSASSGSLDYDRMGVVTGWSMVGSYGDLSELKGVYYLAQDKLWYAEEAITLPAYRAYMTHVDMRRPCKSLSLLVLDEEGDVDEIVNINADGTDGPCYNLAGQRVNSSAKGIVIKKGIKYLNK